VALTAIAPNRAGAAVLDNLADAQRL